MSYKTKKEVLTGIMGRTRIVNGKTYTIYDAYLGTNPITKEPKRLYSSDKVKLAKMVDDFFSEIKRQGEVVTILTPLQIMDAKAAIDLMTKENLGSSLLECMQNILAGKSVRKLKCDVTIGEAYAKFLQEKNTPGHEADYLKTKSTTGKWVMTFGPQRSISEVDIDSFLEYIKQYDSCAPKTYNSHLNYIKTFLNWCAHDTQRYIPENPIRNVRNKEEQWKEPKYMTASDTEKLFRLLERHKEDHPEWLAAAITSFFCGARRAEILRMASDDEAANVHLDDETIRIAKGKGFTRGIKPRRLQIEPNALAWMQSFPYLDSLKMASDGYERQIYRLARKNGITVHKNAGRHTFITMHVAAYDNPEKTQSMVGTSEKMRTTNYQGLASKREGLAYFSIYPSATV